jgi:hypothetical protein
MKICSLVLLGALLSSIRGLGNQDQREVHEYVLKVEADSATKLDMLLIIKSTPNGGPSREQSTIITPYTKKFMAAKCYAWFDTLPAGKSGANGSKYRISLFRDGKPSSEVQSVLEKSNKQTGSLVGQRHSFDSDDGNCREKTTYRSRRRTGNARLYAFGVNAERFQSGLSRFGVRPPRLGIATLVVLLLGQLSF